MAWLLALVLVENTAMGVAFAFAGLRYSKVLELAETNSVSAAKDYLISTSARERIAKVARSVAKDYIQDKTESTGEPYIR